MENHSIGEDQNLPGSGIREREVLEQQKGPEGKKRKGCDQIYKHDKNTGASQE